MDTLEEELLAVDAIYPGCISRDPRSSHRLTIYPFTKDGSNRVSLSLSIPENYPAGSPVIVGNAGISQTLVQETLDSSWTPGEVCLYVLLDKLRELPNGSNANVTQSSARHPSPTVINPPNESSSDDEGGTDFQFAVSEPIVDRKSTFVGRAIEVHSRAEARAALAWLKQHNKKIARATHNIVAWRVEEDRVLMQGSLQIISRLILSR